MLRTGTSTTRRDSQRPNSSKHPPPHGATPLTCAAKSCWRSRKDRPARLGLLAARRRLPSLSSGLKGWLAARARCFASTFFVRLPRGDHRRPQASTGVHARTHTHTRTHRTHTHARTHRTHTHTRTHRTHGQAGETSSQSVVSDQRRSIPQSRPDANGSLVITAHNSHCATREGHEGSSSHGRFFSVYVRVIWGLNALA